MTDAVTICNQALANLGSTGRIDSLTEASNEADYCNIFYADAVQDVLAARPWRFCRRVVALTRTAANPPSAAVSWAYQYEWPSAATRINRLLPETTDGVPEPFEILLDSAGTARVIWTDVPTAYAEINHNLTDPALWSAEFATALAWKLTEKLAMPITGDVRRVQAAASRYYQILHAAGATDGAQGVRREMPDAASMRARG